MAVTGSARFLTYGETGTGLLYTRGHNWRVLSKPDWIDVSYEPYIVETSDIMVITLTSNTGLTDDMLYDEFTTEVVFTDDVFPVSMPVYKWAITNDNLYSFTYTTSDNLPIQLTNSAISKSTILINRITDGVGYCAIDTTSRLYQPLTSGFTEQTNLTSLSFFPNYKIIPAFMFHNCSNLSALTLVEGLTTIGQCAFSTGSRITQPVYLPSTLTGNTSGRWFDFTYIKELQVNCVLKGNSEYYWYDVGGSDEGYHYYSVIGRDVQVDYLKLMSGYTETNIYNLGLRNVKVIEIESGVTTNVVNHIYDKSTTNTNKGYQTYQTLISGKGYLLLYDKTKANDYAGYRLNSNWKIGEIGDTVIILNKDKLSFLTSGGTDTFTIFSNGNWTITAPSWIIPSPISGTGNKTITVRVGENTGSTVLDDYITISTEDYTEQINVKQDRNYLVTDYLTLTVLTNGGIKIPSGVNYSKDNGETWIASTGETVSMVKGEEYMLKWRVGSTTVTFVEYSGITYTLGGNIMSLVYGSDFTGQTEFNTTNNFKSLFSNCTGLTSIDNLILPATTLTNSCYYEMFRGCSSLVTAPDLPATTLAQECYRGMFQGCTSLVTAPDLPASKMMSGSCYNMFYGCSSLVNAPSLPATTLAQSCYRGMFQGCTSLVTAPDLPATTLAASCYFDMFYGCSKLNYIKCLTTNRTPQGYATMNDWVRGVASSGTFVKKSGVSYPTGVNGIPSGWTIQNV